MKQKKHIDIEIDQLTNSIVNVISGEVFQTEFAKVKAKEVKKKDWLFDWHFELKNKSNEVYKMTTVGNKDVIQGLVSIQRRDDYVYVSLVENAYFNRGKDKIYVGVGGNLFAYACKISKEIGHDGFVGFDAKTRLIEHYNKTLGAERALGQRMIITDVNANILINQYFKNK